MWSSYRLERSIPGTSMLTKGPDSTNALCVSALKHGLLHALYHSELAFVHTVMGIDH